MLKLAVFRPTKFYYSPDWEEAFKTLKDNGKHAHVIAGGTGFYELARRGHIPEVKQVVSIMKLGLNYIKQEPTRLLIGATTVLQEVADSGVANSEGLEAIGDALTEIRPVQVRNVATVGGEICISVPIVDLPTALIACEASITIVSPDREERTIPLRDFYVDAFLTKLKYGEIVKEVSVPHKKDGSASAFVKLGRTAYDFNLVNVASSLRLAKNGTIESLRVALGGIKRIPFRASEFERKLTGKNFDEKLVIDTAESTLAKENLLPSVHGSSEYKSAVLPIVVRDCLVRARDRLLTVHGKSDNK